MIPYFYRLYFKPTAQYYVGVQYGKGAHPDNLWDKYFTSSKIVKKLIKEFGLSAFEHKVTKTFSTAKEATTYERRFLLKVKANKNNKFLNLSLGFVESYLATGPCSSLRKESISKARSITKKVECEYCSKIIDPGNYKAWHGDKCKKNPNIDQAILDKRKEVAKLRYDNSSIVPSDNFKKLVKCEYCKLSYNLSNYSKYHGKRCLSNPDISEESIEYREKLNTQLAAARLNISFNVVVN